MKRERVPHRQLHSRLARRIDTQIMGVLVSLLYTALHPLLLVTTPTLLISKRAQQMTMIIIK